MFWGCQNVCSGREILNGSIFSRHLKPKFQMKITEQNELCLITSEFVALMKKSHFLIFQWLVAILG